jgi:hypothetical protein
MLTTGWNFNQYTGTNFWQFLIRPYMETQIEIDSTMSLQRFMQQTFNFSLGKFKTAMFLSFIFQTTGQVCSGFGYSSEQIILQLTTLLDMYDCYKTIIADLCDWSNVWLGEKSKWVDACDPSGNTSTITIKNWELQPRLYDSNLQTDSLISTLGGSSYDNRGCF